jgi:putative SOS response-associated peptidase YedK
MNEHRHNVFITRPCRRLRRHSQRSQPTIPERAGREAWFLGTLEEAWETLTPYPDDLTVAWPVSTRLNAPQNNDAKFIEPA